MADINMEPKSRHSITFWLISGIGLLAVLFFLTRWLNEQKPQAQVAARIAIASTVRHTAIDNWSSINFHTPAANYNEITGSEITVRGTNDYAIYSITEEVLFEKDKSALRSDAHKFLQQIANSIEQRYTSGLIRIYEHANTVASTTTNKQLTQQRVETIRNWLLQNGNITANQISINPLNNTQLGVSLQGSKDQSQNHRIDIVARRSA